MTENSAIWLGSTLGDAASSTGWKGPYSDVDIANIQSLVLTNNDNQGFVIAGYQNRLKITPTGALSVNVETGAAAIRGKIYENTAQNTLTVGANATGNPRLDRVVIRIVYASQTIRLAILEGTAAASPALPSLTQTAATYEISLGYIYVANAAASIADTDIHDEREFLNTFASINDFKGTNNLLLNSEFMSFSAWANAGAANTNPPERWSLVATPITLIHYTRPSQMSRGRAIQVTTNAANEGISQTFNVKASTMYSIKLLTRVTAGDVGSVVVTTNSATPGTITRYTRRTAAWIEEKIFYMTEADATTMTVQLLGLNNGDVIQYGQVLAVEGYVPGPFREFKEFIMFTNYMWDENWNGDLADYKSTGTTTIDYTISYAGAILAKTKALYLFVYTIETVSTANPCGASVRPTGTSVNLIATNLKGCALNFQSESKLEFAYLDNTLTLDYSVIAGGVLSLVPVIYIRGMIT